MFTRVSQQKRRMRLLAMLSLTVLISIVPMAVTHATTQAATPRRGGTLIVRLSGAPDCLDPYKSSSGSQDAVMEHVLIGLLSRNQKNKPIPGIAKSWKVSNGGKTITFTLRPNVKFSDGHTVTSADVKASYDHALNPATKSPVSKSFLTGVTSIAAPNPRTVVLHMKAPSRVILNFLGTSYLGILEKSQLQKLGNNTCSGNLVGAGPYRVASVGTAFSSVTLKLNKYYTNFNEPWAHNKGQPYIPTVVFTSITSDATAISELLAGQLTISNLPGSQLSRVQGNKNFVLHRILAQGQDELEFNIAKAPWNNKAVRKAVAEAIDRSAIVKSTFNGLAKPVYSPDPPTNLWSDPKAKSIMPKLNPGAAASAVAAAGAKGPYTLINFSLPEDQTNGEIIQSELGQAGMTVNIVSKSVGDALDVVAKGDFDLFLLDWGNPDPDAMFLLYNSSQASSKGGIDYTGYVNAALDKALLDGREQLNLKKARADYIKAQRIIEKNIVMVPLVTPVSITATSSKLQGWHQSINGGVLYQDLWLK